MMAWSFPPAVSGSAVVIALAGLIGLFLRLVGPWRKQISEMEERLRKELMESHRQCEAELRLVRHRHHGSRQIIYALLHLFDMPAARRKETLATIRAELAALEQSEAVESGIVSAAALQGSER